MYLHRLHYAGTAALWLTIGAALAVLLGRGLVWLAPLDVATSGATLFRQVEGSMRVPLFGGIFMNHLGRELAHRLPSGAHGPTDAYPVAIEHLRTAISTIYAAAAAVVVVAPALSWRLRDVPLRETAPVEALEPEPRTPAGSRAGG